jgi:hypothetical protein
MPRDFAGAATRALADSSSSSISGRRRWGGDVDSLVDFGLRPIGLQTYPAGDSRALAADSNGWSRF